MPESERSEPRWAKAADLIVKAAFVACCLWIWLHLNDVQYRGKAFESRLIGYPIGVLLVPIGWWVAQRWKNRRIPYPWLADALITLPFVTDLLGNIFNLFNTVEPFDDWLHFLNWFLLSAGVGALVLRSRLSPAGVAATVIAFGAAAAILWEGAEWLLFIRFGTELSTAYQDTLLDEHLGLLGATLAAIWMYFLARRRSRT